MDKFLAPLDEVGEVIFPLCPHNGKWRLTSHGFQSVRSSVETTLKRYYAGNSMMELRFTPEVVCELIATVDGLLELIQKERSGE